MGERVQFLSPEWCALVVHEAKAMPVVPGATGVRVATIVFPDDSTRTFTLRFVDGVITEALPGKVPDASYAIEMPLDAYIGLNFGDDEPFQRGILNQTVRMTGDMDRTQPMLQLIRSEGYEGLLNRVHLQTDYPT